ncbi:MAG: hypothetical protein AAF624_02650, partial [Bacteroidota bacterium]
MLGSVLLCHAAQAQTGTAQPARPAAEADTAPADSVAVRVIDRRISGERQRWSKDDLLAFVRSRENHGLFDITGLTPGYWIYRLGTNESLPGWLGGALRRVGDEPALLDTTVVASDAARLAALYQQDGYRQAEVIAEVDTLGQGRARVTFDIRPGLPSMVDTIRYAGIEALPIATQRALVEETLLDARAADEPRTLVATGQRFAEADLLAERSRLIEALQRTVGRPVAAWVRRMRDNVAGQSIEEDLNKVLPKVSE